MVAGSVQDKPPDEAAVFTLNCLQFMLLLLREAAAESTLIARIESLLQRSLDSLSQETVGLIR